MKLFSCPIQLSTKFILLINVKIPTIVGILTFNSKINITSDRLKARTISVFQHLSFISSCNFMLSLVEHVKKIMTSRSGGTIRIIF